MFSVSRINVASRQYTVGFKDSILEYIDVITELSEYYPEFHGIPKDTVDFASLYQYNISRILEDLSSRGIDDVVGVELAGLVFWSSLDLPELYILLNDRGLMEVYVNGEKAPVYINHVLHGSMYTNISLSRKGLNALTRISELIHGEGINALGGNLEVEIELVSNDKFRIVIDTFPLTYGEYNLVIRRMVSQYSDLDSLYRSGFLSKEYYLIIRKVAERLGSFIICGEPNSGKTTLLNAILKAIPAQVRKIYFEEARELEDLRRDGFHQVFYRFSGILKSSLRSNQTLFTLRRSPEYVVLGEVISDDDIHILLDTLLFGYKVAATIHSANVDSLMERFRKVYGEKFYIPIKNVDLILLTRREILDNRRYLYRIYKIDRDRGVPVEVVSDSLVQLNKGEVG